MRVNEYVRVNNTKGVFGIEVEMEGRNIRYDGSHFWRIEEDGSLRPQPDCCEFVLAKPLSYEKAMEAIREINTIHNEQNTQLKWSYRCSTHVHYNVQEFDVRDLYKSIYLYYIFENMLVNWSGKERVGNRFCLRLTDSHFIINNINTLFNQDLMIDANSTRYSALNIASICKYGSVEFRSLEGTLDEVRISKWLTLISSVMQAGKRYKTVEEIFDIAKGNINTLGVDVFGVENFEMLKYEGWQQNAFSNISLMLELINNYQEVAKHEEDRDVVVQQRVEERKPAKAAAPRKAAAAQMAVEVPFQAFEFNPELGMQHRQVGRPAQGLRNAEQVQLRGNRIRQVVLPEQGVEEQQNQLADLLWRAAERNRNGEGW